MGWFGGGFEGERGYSDKSDPAAPPSIGWLDRPEPPKRPPPPDGSLSGQIHWVETREEASFAAGPLAASILLLFSEAFVQKRRFVHFLHQKFRKKQGVAQSKRAMCGRAMRARGEL
jgi:hypothetical protein